MSEVSVSPPSETNDNEALEEAVCGVKHHHGEPSIHVLYDVMSYFKFRIPKCKNAIWVKGLTKEDEEYAIQQLQLEEYRKEASKLAKLFVIPLGSQWLRYPNIVGVLFLTVMLYELLCPPQDRMEELVLCSSVENLMPLGIRRGESFMSLVSRVSPFIISPAWLGAAAYAITTSFRVGLTTHDFSALCAVGTAILYPLAVAVQVYMLISGAFREIKESSETDILFCMYYFCAMMKLFSPLAAVALVCPAIVLAMSGISRVVAKALRYMTLLPVFAAVLWYYRISDSGADDTWWSSILTVYLVTVFTWGFVILKCLLQDTFEMPVIVPPVEN